MAGNNFNITAQIHLQAPNAKSFSRDLQKQLKNPKVSVNLENAPKTVSGLNKVAKASRDVEKAAKGAGKGADYMGRQFGSAFKQIMKYDIARRVFSLFSDAIEQGVKDAIAFERAMVKVAQVSGASASQMKDLERTIGRVAKQFGISSQVLAKTTLILKQTGLSVNDTKLAMEALAKTELAPTFENITDTAEMAIAAMRQFGIEASKLEGLLGRINVVAGNFAVEASDIGVAIRRAGGAFKSAGGQISELIALFTSVRSTTRETAETIATGFRTIFTRMQRPSTLKFLRQFGIELTDLAGNFIGPYKAVEKLHGALKGLKTTDVRYSMIVEQLGGFRQVSKVIPLIQQFGTAQSALNMQQAESGSLASDAAKAQLSLAVQIQKLTENVKELFREIVGSDSFQIMAKGALALANGIVQVGKALAPVIPLITAMMGMKMAGWAMGSMKMMGGRGLSAATGSMGGGGGGMGGFNKGGRVKGFSEGGWVPGSGNGDTVPAMLEPGEFVLKKSAAQAYGSKLNGINKMAKGGSVNAGDFSRVGLGKRVIREQRVGGLYKKADVGMDGNVQFNENDNFRFKSYDVDNINISRKPSFKKNTPDSYILNHKGRKTTLAGSRRASAKTYLASKTGANFEGLLNELGLMKTSSKTGGNKPFDGMKGKTWIEARSRKAKTSGKTILEKACSKQLQMA